MVRNFLTHLEHQEKDWWSYEEAGFDHVCFGLCLSPQSCQMQEESKSNLHSTLLPVWMYRQEATSARLDGSWYSLSEEQLFACVNIFLLGWCSYISTLRYGCFVIPVPWITEFLWARSNRTTELHRCFTNHKALLCILQHALMAAWCLFLVTGPRALSQADHVIRWGCHLNSAFQLWQHFCWWRSHWSLLQPW